MFKWKPSGGSYVENLEDFEIEVLAQIKSHPSGSTSCSVSNGLLWSKNNTFKLYLIDHIENLNGQFFIIWSISYKIVNSGLV